MVHFRYQLMQPHIARCATDLLCLRIPFFPFVCSCFCMHLLLVCRHIRSSNAIPVCTADDDPMYVHDRTYDHPTMHIPILFYSECGSTRCSRSERPVGPSECPLTPYPEKVRVPSRVRTFSRRNPSLYTFVPHIEQYRPMSNDHSNRGICIYMRYKRSL